MTQSEREKLESLLKKLKEKERPDLSVRAQIHSIEELLNSRR